MKISQLVEKFNLTILSSGEDRNLTGGFCGDLLSWVMANGYDGAAWFTVMGNINAVAVACLNDIGCMVLCQDSSINDDALAKAIEENIWVLKTSMPVFDIAGSFYSTLEG